MECQFIKTDGRKCQAYAVDGSNYCFWHDPKLSQKRAAARKKGGFNRHVGKRSNRSSYDVETIQDVMEILKDALNDALLLENSQSRARTVGYLSQILIKGIETSELERRLANLERRFEGI